MIIPHQSLTHEALQSIAESFVLREGTDYGEHEITFEQKVSEVLEQLRSGQILIEYSEEYESIDLIDSADATGFKPHTN